MDRNNETARKKFRVEKISSLKIFATYDFRFFYWLKKSRLQELNNDKRNTLLKHLEENK